MSLLNQLKPKEIILPPRGILAGVPGVGKTTFVCSATRPAVIACERGLVGLEHVPQFEPATYKDIVGFLDECIGSAPGSLGFETLAIDTLDALESMIYQAVIDEAKVTSPKVIGIEDVGGGYGKGYMRGRELLEALLQRLDAINKKHLVATWITSHVGVKTNKQPDGVEFNYWALKGNDKFNSIVLGWADMVLFATFEVFQAGDKRDKHAVGGARIIHTEKSPQWEAKNRYGLPAQIPMDWTVLAKEMAALHRPTLEAKVMDLLASSTFDKPTRSKMLADVPKLTPDRLRKMVAYCEANQQAPDEIPM